MGKYKDINSKTIFEDAELCAQFIRDNVDIPILKNVRPEDIEDVSARYVTYFGVEFNADTVKHIRIRSEDGEQSFFMVSLIEHKSKVDYNVSIQLLKYMACIWADYEKANLSKARNKEFRYPPILPIVYYEGSGKWTADMRLRDRIFMKEIFGEYIPDMTYLVVRNHDYSNEELLSREDGMSLLMLINKIQTVDDLSEFLKLPQDKVNRILQSSPERVVEIIAAMVQALCYRMNASEEETDECVEKVRNRQMGYLFENMEKMDIQAERQNTAKAREQLAMAEEKLAQKDDELAQKDDELVYKDAQIEMLIKSIIVSGKKNGSTKESIIEDLVGEMSFDKNQVEFLVQKYWD